MFGLHEHPVNLKYQSLLLQTSYDKNIIFYSRKLADETVEKKISSKNKKMILNPVEPTNTPTPISKHLLIKLTKPLIIEPQSSHSIFLTFPVEIGVFIKKENKTKLIDVFSLRSKKFTLYGEPTGGIICNYWTSDVHLTAPELSNNYEEGVLDLTINNISGEWCEIKKVIFNAYHMKIFYDDNLVCMKGYMKIKEKEVAETGFSKSSANKSMKNSIEVYSLSKLNITSTAYIMEFGL